MSLPAPDTGMDLPPAARHAVAAVVTAPTRPAKLLVTGGIGTGKTSVLTAVRSALRDAGRLVLSRPPHPDDAVDAAYVVDDAQLLGDDELGEFAEHITDPAATVVVATAPLVHRPALRALVTALQRESPAVSLGPLPVAEVNRILTSSLGAPASAETVRSVLTATAGLPFLVTAVARSTIPPDQSAQFTLIDRLCRIDVRTRDTLLITSLSQGLGPDDVAAVLHCSGEEAVDLVDRARASGLVEPSFDRRFVRLVHECLTQLAGAARHYEIETSLLNSQLEMSTLSADLAVQLAEHGLRDDRLADALIERAVRVHGRPARAAALYRAAAKAGSISGNTRLADALALTGDCSTAGAMADELLESDDPAQRAAAVRIAASIAAHDGNAAAAADLFRWLGPYPDAAVSAAGVIVGVAAGDLTAAHEALTIERTGPPTAAARAAHSLAEGVLSSLDQPFPATVARLGQALVSEHHAGVVAPDTPSALVTLVALHGGDPVRARSVIGRAVRTEDADEVSFTVHRHRLLQGWVRMQDGQLGAASADAATADQGLHRRDALWAAALRTAIARRAGDSGAVQQHWYAAMEVLAEYSVDLFSLLPLGELWVAGARMRQVDRMEHALSQAFELLESLGKPVLWSVPLHWAGVHAGILASSPAAVAPHGQALTAAAGESAFARALAHAGRTWLRVLGNQVDIDEVTVAARALAQYGLTWDGTRLASQAALHTPDARVSQAMLQLARDLKQSSAVDETPLPESAAATSAASTAAQRTPSSAARLSDREREVAELLLLGMPYRDIGSQLFISAKTVEHHVARIRRRLGAESRSEMLSMLRAMLARAELTTPTDI